MRINKHPLSYTILVFSLLSSISLLLLSICAKTSNIYYLLPDLLGWATLLEGLIAILGISLTDSPATVPIVSAFCLRAALALINAYVTPLPYSQADAAACHRQRESGDAGNHPFRVHPVLLCPARCCMDSSRSRVFPVPWRGSSRSPGRRLRNRV